LGVGILEHIAGPSVPQKHIQINANPGIALKFLKRRRLPKTAI